MSASRLREAAALMRSRAEAATKSAPLVRDDDDSPLPPYDQWFALDALSSRNVTSIEDSEHIASWHPAVALAVADWLVDIAERHAEDPDPLDLMLHWDEECPTGECVEGDGHSSVVCTGCYPSWEGMDGHSLWPCREFKAALAVADAYLGTDRAEASA